MSRHSYQKKCVAASAALGWAVYATVAARADTLMDQIGVTQLRAEVPSLTGAGIIVAQPEATDVDMGTFFDHDDFEVSPTAASVTVPITYYDKNGNVTTIYDSTRHSQHADTVASFLAGNGIGVATQLSQILNFNANYYEEYVLQNVALPIQPQVINQSFTQDAGGPYTAAVIDQAWDTFVITQNVLIASGAGNGGDVLLPATAFNVIAVGAYLGHSSVSEPGQLAKPDIVVPMPTTPVDYSYTSFSTPVVSGAAALLLQAAGSGDGTDPRAI
ncbi:MAG TPA: S8 family serine peptidase, partial [Phycisphaerae bacterium]